MHEQEIQIQAAPPIGPEQAAEAERILHKYKAGKAALDRQKAIAAEQAVQLEMQAPDVEYARNVLASDGLHTVNAVAVHLGISAIRLNKFLIAENWIYRRGDVYYPAIRIRVKGYCDFHVVPYLNSQGERMTREHLKWTEAGRRAIIELWNKRHPAA